MGFQTVVCILKKIKNYAAVQLLILQVKKSLLALLFPASPAVVLAVACDICTQTVKRIETL